MTARHLFAVVGIVSCSAIAFAQPANGLKPVTKKDVAYGKRDGHVMVMDVVVPKKPNGKGIILCVSGGFESSEKYRLAAHQIVAPQFLDRGYTIFAVMHSSQPTYTVPDIVDDIHKAVRFIKSRANDYKVDAEKLGIAGMSSGGHLALMMGCAWKEANPNSADPLERQSSRVAAVACFFPPTDFIEFDDKEDLTDDQKQFRTLFDIRRRDPKTSKLERITDQERRAIGKLCSPLYCAKDKKDAAPTFIIHGKRDKLIPVHQSEKLRDEMKNCGAVCKLEIEDIDHNPVEAIQFLPRVVDWFDSQLLNKK